MPARVAGGARAGVDLEAEREQDRSQALGREIDTDATTWDTDQECTPVGHARFSTIAGYCWKQYSAAVLAQALGL